MSGMTGSGEEAGRGPNALELEGVSKAFTMHLQGGVRLDVVEGVSFTVAPGECVVLGGPSGAGKSSIMKMVAGTYAATAGAIRVRHRGEPVDIVRAGDRTLIAVRRESLSIVSQFLRAIPRVPAIDLVVENAGTGEARERAAALLTRLNLPRALWALPPATFSGGEKQRVNVAAGFVRETPLLLLDEPTASLDAHNRDVVVTMIEEKKAAGTAILGIFHDAEVRARVADRIVDVTGFAPKKAAA